MRYKPCAAGCGGYVTYFSSAKYCSPTCRKRAWRHRHRRVRAHTARPTSPLVWTIPLTQPQELMSDTQPSPTRSFQIRRTRSVTCMLCGRPLDYVLDLTRPSPTLPPNLRCDICGGSAMLGDEILDQRVYTDDFNWDADRPRLGRPPKWLVEKRRRRAIKESLAS